MTKQFFSKNWTPLWSRFASCIALSLYMFAIVAMPALHEHVLHTETACEQSAPVSDDSCSVCEFVRSTVYLVVTTEGHLSQVTIDFNISSADSILSTVSVFSVANETVLPPCRAPPVG